MTKFNDFLGSENEPTDEEFENMQRVSGQYGCQSCDKYAHVSYFDEQKGEMMWFCQDGHKSSFTVG